MQLQIFFVKNEWRTAHLRQLHIQWGKNVRESRAHFGWQQQTLAALVGIRPGTLSNIEAGRRCPSDDIKVRIAGALRKPVGELFPWAADVPPFPTSALKVAA